MNFSIHWNCRWKRNPIEPGRLIIAIFLVNWRRGTWTPQLRNQENEKIFMKCEKIDGIDGLGDIRRSKMIRKRRRRRRRRRGEEEEEMASLH